MKTLEKLSKKAARFCEYEGLELKKVKEAMKSGSFSIQKCESKREMEEEGVDFSFPYVVYNPYNIDINQ